MTFPLNLEIKSKKGCFQLGDRRVRDQTSMESRVPSALNCASAGAWGTEMGSTSNCGGKASGRRRRCSCWALKGSCVSHAGGRYSSKGNWEWGGGGGGEGGKDKEM